MTLLVDYGNRRVSYSHLVESENTSIEVCEWCKINFKPMSYYYSYAYGGWYFVNKKDAVFFSLRWV